MADFDRRSFIKIGSIAAFSYIKWGDVLQRKAEAASRRGDEVSVIHLFLTGGMAIPALVLSTRVTNPHRILQNSPRAVPPGS